MFRTWDLKFLRKFLNFFTQINASHLETRFLILKSVYWNTGKLNLFPFFLDTYLEKPGSNETLTAAEMTQSLTLEDHPLASMIEDLFNGCITDWKRNQSKPTEELFIS